MEPLSLAMSGQHTGSAADPVKPWLYFALAFGWSWLLWIPAGLLKQGEGALPATLLHYAGGIGPAVAGVALITLAHRRERQRDYWRRLIDLRRIGAGWYSVIFLTVPLLAALAALLDLLLGGAGARLEAARRLIARPWSILPFIAFTMLFGPLPEELGWRGYALDGLQARSSALGSSLILGATWSLWHLPLFFIPGTYQNELGLGTLSFWLFVVGLLPQSVLMTWIYNNTQRSTLSAVLFHFMINFTGQLFELTKGAELYQGLLWIATAVAITALGRAMTVQPGRDG
jgi:membrane protease YdiL (CAAX protease family)